jgi:hypothetical protein
MESKIHCMFLDTVRGFCPLNKIIHSHGVAHILFHRHSASKTASIFIPFVPHSHGSGIPFDKSSLVEAMMCVEVISALSLLDDRHLTPLCPLQNKKSDGKD